MTLPYPARAHWTETPNRLASAPTGMCGEPKKCSICPSDFLCMLKAAGEQQFIQKRKDGWCPSREDETHCIHWWDAEGPCCNCGEGSDDGVKA